MPELQPLRADHADALLTFEQDNRGYFAASVPDRGDAYFREFAVRHTANLAEQAEGTLRMHVLVTAEGEILGRFNLFDLADGSAELGFRLAAHATGRGLATEAVRRLFTLAREDYGLTRITAAAEPGNQASRAVLQRTGFHPTGTTTRSGRPCVTYAKTLDGA
ncbi:GNAT family N-acetyltransferase [Streptomyces sp. SID5785]|uniref:GNAT family N-acetyltransferase n=1 Tax=Streptomyces sp. SID5785 TaxID=2690309 RepID=UPI001361DA70|nr:GNAT family N-acetyltransferase [Streptomyces sp. SID5785]MZD04841.1 GNAT family N-acetyltransferase [Streptomyces sp. SID5785]